MKFPAVRDCHWNWSPNLWPNFVTGPRPVSRPDCDQFPCQVKSHPLGHHFSMLFHHYLSTCLLHRHLSSRFMAIRILITHPSFLTDCYVWLWGRTGGWRSSGCFEQKFHYRTPHFLSKCHHSRKRYTLESYENWAILAQKSLRFFSHLIIFLPALLSETYGNTIMWTIPSKIPLPYFLFLPVFKLSDFKLLKWDLCSNGLEVFAAEQIAQFRRRIPPQKKTAEKRCTHFLLNLIRGKKFVLAHFSSSE